MVWTKCLMEQASILWFYQTSVYIVVFPPHKGGTGSEMDVSWIRPMEQMNDLVKRKLSHLRPGPVLHPPYQRLLTKGHNPPEELMYHEGQRASEAMHNVIKYSTSILHI